jgi:epoxyqueuosine reductase
LYAIPRERYKHNTAKTAAVLRHHAAARERRIFARTARLRHDGTMTPAERTRWITQRASAQGFDLCGVAPLGAEVSSDSDSRENSASAPFAELRRLPEWLARGYAGEMNYLHDARRADPRSLLAGGRSLIVVALNYHAPQPLSTEVPPDPVDSPPRGWISRYAWGDDYHEVILRRLNALIDEMRGRFAEPFEARAYVDTGPIIERVAAKYAGLGWLAKNTCLINQKLGSWLFWGVIITTLALEPTLAPDEPPPAGLCGSCTRCLDACPTHAFPEPYVLDARRCISYLTIELRGAIPEELRAGMGRAAVGCDICQDVCPWNRKAPDVALPAFQPRRFPDESLADFAPRAGDIPGAANESSAAAKSVSLFAPELEWLASLSQRDFSRVFRASAIKRAKWRGVVRNACVALGNSNVASSSPAFLRIVRLLENLAASGDPLVAEHAGWALARLTRARAPASHRPAD